MIRRFLFAASLTLALMPATAFAQSDMGIPSALQSAVTSPSSDTGGGAALSGGGAPTSSSFSAPAPTVVTPQNVNSNSPTAGLYSNGATNTNNTRANPNAAPSNGTGATPATQERLHAGRDQNVNKSDTTATGATSNEAAAAIAAHVADKTAQQPTYDPHGEPYNSRYFLSQNTDFTVTLAGRAGLPSEDFSLHIAVRYPVTSCAKFSGLPNQVTYSDGTMTVALKDYSIDFRDAGGDTGDGAEEGCQMHLIAPSVDIPITRDELEKQAIKTIVVTIDRQRDVFKVMLAPHYIRLEMAPSAAEVPRLHPRTEGVRTPLVHWFYPQGTLLLYVPGAHPGQDVHEQLDAMARSHGLKPLTELWPDFVPPLDTPGFAYYVDEQDRLLKGVKPEDTKQIGEITVTRTLYGLNGDETEDKQIPVFARAPQDND